MLEIRAGAMVFVVPTSSSFVVNARSRFGLEKAAREMLDEACWWRSMNCTGERTEGGESRGPGYNREDAGNAVRS